MFYDQQPQFINLDEFDQVPPKQVYVPVDMNVNYNLIRHQRNIHQQNLSHDILRQGNQTQNQM